jgi:hypothetical protein
MNKGQITLKHIYHRGWKPLPQNSVPNDLHRHVGVASSHNKDGKAIYLLFLNWSSRPPFHPLIYVLLLRTSTQILKSSSVQGFSNSDFGFWIESHNNSGITNSGI